jgi:hypothetical protein
LRDIRVPGVSSSLCINGGKFKVWTKSMCGGVWSGCGAACMRRVGRRRVRCTWRASLPFRIQERMNSPLEGHEVRLRGLDDVEWRRVRFTWRASLPPASRKRMNSPLEGHEVRLRGLPGREISARRLVWRCGE